MKRYILILAMLFSPGIMLAQEEQEPVHLEIQRLRVKFGTGADVNFGSTAVKFLEVISDSRCPRKVTCIWPGEARVLLGVTNNGNYIEKEVVLAGGVAELPLANDLLLRFTQLQPYPETSVKIDPEAYFLEFSALFPAEDQ